MNFINILKLLAIAWLSITISSCQNGPTESAEALATLPAGTTSPDFEAFYGQCHADSAFQVEHIAWPLDGNLQSDGAGGSTDARWTQEDWILHKPLELGQEYIREIDANAPDLVVERVKTKSGSYIIERRFAKFGGEWMLIYYRVADIG